MSKDNLGIESATGKLSCPLTKFYRNPENGTKEKGRGVVLQNSRKQVAVIAAGKFDGYSESWTIDSFQVNNLNEFMKKIK